MHHSYDAITKSIHAQLFAQQKKYSTTFERSTSYYFSKNGNFLHSDILTHADKICICRTKFIIRVSTLTHADGRPKTTRFLRPRSHLLEGLPKAIGWYGSRHVDHLMRDGMLKAEPARMKADAAIRIAARSPILQVATDGTTHLGQLASYLVVATRLELNLQQIIAFRMGHDTIAEHRALAARHLAVVGTSLVGTLVARQPMRERSLLLRRAVGHDGPIRLADPLMLRKEGIQAGQSLAGTRKKYDTTNGAIQTMDNTKEDVTRLLVTSLQVVLHDIRERRVARLVALHNLAAGLVDYYDVVVFVERSQRNVIIKTFPTSSPTRRRRQEEGMKSGKRIVVLRITYSCRHLPG